MTMTSAAAAAAAAATDSITPPTADTAPVPETCDVLVVGGGPAGSTAAALLAQQGRRVVVLEKAHHPRFHIGESLLPGNVALFEQLGVREQVEAIGMPKFGIEFVSPDHAHRSYLEFADAWDGASMPSAWQVRRSELDELLFRNAAARGATTVEGCRVRDVAFDADGATVQAQMDDGTPRRWRAAFVLDASGRDTLLSTKFRLKERNPRHNSSALFGHYTGARRLAGQKEGNISILWFDHGWFWFIPLADGTTSVGAVCWPYYLKSRDKPLREFFEDTIALCPELADRLRDATLQDGRVHATGNYSYTSSRCSGERYLLLGDAYTFIDPMFSSGVYLAMQSAFQAAEAVAAILDTPAQAARARAAYEAGVQHGPKAYSWVIFRSTNPTIRDMFMHPRNTLRVKEALLSLLAGDIYGIRGGPAGSLRGGSPIGGALRAFKLIYYAISLRHARRSWRGWRRRQHNIRDTGRLRGETIQDAP